MKEFDILAALKHMPKNAIRLQTTKDSGIPIGRLGGLPDVPKDFIWPTFETDTFDDKEIKPRPLSFIAQFDCAALAPLDKENLLPHEGILSFFYELGSQTWGYSPENAGSAKVYWFEDKALLFPAAFPADLDGDYRLPAVPLFAYQETQYPDFQDFSEICTESGSHSSDEIYDEWEDFCDNYESVIQTLQGDDTALRHQLLGWPRIIQNSMAYECELVGRGYYMGNALKDIPEDEIADARAHSLQNWVLLFQLESDEFGDYCLDFGDCGNIYFYIRKEDLAARRFERVWLISQCY